MGLTEERARFLKGDFERGFVRYSGIRATEAREGVFESRVQIREHHRQQDGFVHAGLMATMADHTAGYAAFTLVPEGYQILTIEFKINFLRPAAGEELVCRAKIIRPGSQILVGESRVFDLGGGQEREVARALVTLASVPKERITRAG
jgi:uncharacterized protein (TIGR00369 family)